MSVHDLYEMLTEMVRQGPGHVAAFGLGLATLALLLLSVHWFLRRPLQRRIEQLTDENNRLREARAASEADLRISRADKERLQSDLKSFATQVEALREAKAKLEASLSYLKEENDRLRAAGQAALQESQSLRETKGRLEGQLELAHDANQTLRAAHDALQSELSRLREENRQYLAERDGLVKEREQLRAIQLDQARALRARKKTVAALAQQVAELTEQAQRLASFDGKVWEKPPVVAVPEFRPLQARRAPIIALANLKGGVGKTTLAANLGAMLSDQRRVLLVDLDYQGSLTSLCLPPEWIEEIRRRDEFVDRLLLCPNPDADLLARCCHAVPERANLRILAADESLADLENRLMARWLLNPENGDVRHILRAYLHSAAAAEQYDYVFLDCPPRLTTACVNALAAADFVLIPVIPDQTSVEAVPRQLRALRKLQGVLGPHLEVLGLVANRTNPREEGIQRERAVWDSLRGRCEEPWGAEVYQFRTMIRQKGAFAEAARANRFAVAYREVEGMFRDLADELLQRIRIHEHQGRAGIPAESQPAA